MKKIILFFISILFSICSFAQVREDAGYKTDATLPPDFETYNIRLGEFYGNKIIADSLKYLMNEKILVHANHSDEKIKVEKFTFSYMKYLDKAIFFKGENDTLNSNMKDAMLHANKGDVFYIEAKFSKNNTSKSAVMSLNVK
jgi:hypothetical protein